MFFVTMSVLSWLNGIRRLWETCTAATNCPRFRNPLAAVTTLVPDGSSDWSLLASCVCDVSFCCTGESDVEPDALVVLPVLVVPLVPADLADEFPCDVVVVDA